MIDDLIAYFFFWFIFVLVSLTFTSFFASLGGLNVIIGFSLAFFARKIGLVNSPVYEDDSPPLFS
jgi:hypothetical protein